MKYLLFCVPLFLFSCQKDEELSKARVLWGTWKGNETKKIYDNPTGKTLSTTLSDFEIGFYHTNKGYIKGQVNQNFLWAVQDDPNVLIISPDLFSIDSLHMLHFNTTELFYIGDFSSQEVSLHIEFITHNDSLNITTEKNWILTPK